MTVAGLPDTRLLTAAEVAERLAVSEKWVYQKARLVNNPLPTVRFPDGRTKRFHWPAVERWAGIGGDG